MAKMTINGQTFEGSVDELVELSAKIAVKGSYEEVEVRMMAVASEALYKAVRASEVSETITHDGVEYKRVDREAREGDVVVFTDSKSAYSSNCVPYGPIGDDLTFLGDVDCYFYVYADDHNRTPANVKVYEPIIAKPAPLQVGDYAKVVAHNNDNGFGGAVGDIVKVIRVRNERYSVEELYGGSYGGNPHAKKEALVRATDEEVAEAKRQQAEKAVADKWAEIGRKPNEFKVGDAVQYKKAFTTVSYVGRKYIRIRQSSNVEHNIAVNPANLTLVFPVESKFGGDSE